ncbi:MAG: efflux RND transporter periplasmic adaptor subunit [Tannerella sp.]|jgi:RND family efflux transporter MFP subunit|nr:efflux RND transporter periplasmic adaptor subunit [Tannerella sp.]
MIFLSLVILVLATLVACSGSPKGEDGETVETVLPEVANEVTVMTLQATDFNHEWLSNGRLSAGRSAELRFESAEPVAAIYVKNGDRVTKGQKLAELAAFRLENKTLQAKDALERAGLELQDILIGQGFALEDSADVPASVMRLVRTKSGYEQALAQYQLSVYEEQHATLTAPFDGIVANLFAKPFNTASTTDVFCTIIDPHSLEASFTVLESELPLIQTGDKALITPFSMPDRETEGRISEINPLVDENGMVQVKASVGNPGRFFEGMHVRVGIRRSLGKQWVVPKSAVVLRSGKQVVFTLVDGKAFWAYVQTGLENSDSYTITDGLKEGDVVITGGNINLAHESPVKVIQ